MDGERRTEALLDGPFNQLSPMISPDGRWITYESHESGRPEVYVRPFPDVESGGRWQISTAGGRWPLWTPDGGEILYLQPSVLRAGTMMAAAVEPGRTFSAGSPRALFEVAYSPNFSGRSFDVSADGQRLLMIKPSAQQDDNAPPPQLVVVLNWIEELKRGAAVPGR
jgi:serine/threonine-protein kinase